MNTLRLRPGRAAKYALGALGLLWSLSLQANADYCQQARDVYQQNREEQREGYSIQRGRWLRCMEQEAREAVRRYCKLKREADLRQPLLRQLEQKCRGYH